MDQEILNNASTKMRMIGILFSFNDGVCTLICDVGELAYEQKKVIAC